jgi:hypothetical protein
MLSALGPSRSSVSAVVRAAMAASQLPASQFHTASARAPPSGNE